MRGVAGGRNQTPITASMRKCLPCLWALGFGKKFIGKLTGINPLTVHRMRKARGIEPSKSNGFRKPKEVKPKEITKATQLALGIELDEQTKRVCSKMLGRAIYKRRPKTILTRQKKRLRRLMRDQSFRRERRDYLAQWKLKNRDRLRSSYREYHNKWRSRNRDLVRAYRKRASVSPRFKVIRNLRCRLRQILKGSKKAYGTMKLIGCTRQELLLHIQSQFRPGMEWNNYGTHWHVDHIKPCASFDLSDPEQQRACFHYMNLQPLEAQENMRKGAKTDWSAPTIGITPPPRLVPVVLNQN